MAISILNALRPSSWTAPAIQAFVLAAHAVPIAVGFAWKACSTGFGLGKKLYVSSIERLPE
jgi:hypothetical protein